MSEPDQIPKITNLQEFLEHFANAHRDDNFLAVKYGNYSVEQNEIPGELVDWTIQYLQYM